MRGNKPLLEIDTHWYNMDFFHIDLKSVNNIAHSATYGRHCTCIFNDPALRPIHEFTIQPEKIAAVGRAQQWRGGFRPVAKNRRAQSLRYHPVRMDQIELVTTKQILNGLQLKQKEKRNHSIAQRVLLEVCENATTVGQILPAGKAIAVSGYSNAIDILC